ncbi:hypothetical protein T4E_3686 [Trichinella pseudospiralis]|uniref:Uncharacterized protein n=1 Tax=Trichinella pseudospiralis TaxID=6337 RepID=A0A0V0Y6X6_TRIPS|nr:hypothetical protein T4E_3686 [Trichinella pseudospiralis]
MRVGIGEKAVFVVTSSLVFALDCLLKKARDRKKRKSAGQYGRSPNSDGRANNLAVVTDDPA